MVFALIVFLNDVLKDPLTVQVGDATSTDMPLSSQETGSLQGLSEAGQGRKAIQPGFVDQGRSWVPGSESRFFNSDFVSTEKGLPRQSLDMLRMAQTRQMLAAYTRSLQVRATQAGIPPHQAARLSAEVASVADFKSEEKRNVLVRQEFDGLPVVPKYRVGCLNDASIVIPCIVSPPSTDSISGILYRGKVGQDHVPLIRRRNLGETSVSIDTNSEPHGFTVSL